jgi:hypothetical protein
MRASDSVQLRGYRAGSPFALSAGDEAGENSSVSPLGAPGANGVSYASGVYRFTHGSTKLKVSTAVQQRPKQDQQVKNGEAKKQQTGPERDQQKIDRSKPWFHRTAPGS